MEDEKTIKKLKDGGHDGLCNSENECGCGFGCFAPCESINEDCEPAKYNAEEDWYYPTNRKENKNV